MHLFALNKFFCMFCVPGPKPAEALTSRKGYDIVQTDPNDQDAMVTNKIYLYLHHIRPKNGFYRLATAYQNGLPIKFIIGIN